MTGECGEAGNGGFTADEEGQDVFVQGEPITELSNQNQITTPHRPGIGLTKSALANQTVDEGERIMFDRAAIMIHAIYHIYLGRQRILTFYLLLESS